MLPVLCLKRYWEQALAARLNAERMPPTSDSLRQDLVLLAGLRLGVRETLDILITKTPPYEENEQ